MEKSTPDSKDAFLDGVERALNVCPVFDVVSGDFNRKNGRILYVGDMAAPLFMILSMIMDCERFNHQSWKKRPLEALSLHKHISARLH